MKKQTKTSQPRKSYPFFEMQVGDTHSVKITEEDPRAGARALCAAYAYGRRNKMRFCGVTRHTPKSVFMDISRWK